MAVPLLAMAETTPSPGVSAGTYVQAMLALGLIVSLLLGTAWLARKVSGGKGFGQAGMRVVGGVALGPRERIVLVEVGDTWLVVGIVPGQIRTLHTLPKGEALPEGLSAANDKPFAQWLKQIMERRGND
jgi:flagellar protein FliO/FliZ